MTSPTPDIDVSAQKERLAQWMIAHSFATGHGDTFEDLLLELGGGVDALLSALSRAEKERDVWKGQTDNAWSEIEKLEAQLAAVKAERDEARDYAAQVRIRERNGRSAHP